MTDPRLRTTAGRLDELNRRLAVADNPGGARADAKRAAKGIPDPRARMTMLFDPGTFVEIGKLAKAPDTDETGYGDGVVVGHGLVEGRPVAAFAHDQTVYGGTVGEVFGRKVAAVMELAGKVGCPIVGINDSAGARIQDAVTSLAWYAELGRRNELLSGLAPQVSMMLGKCAGGAVYSPANTDVLVGVRSTHMFVTGPDVLAQVTGEKVSAEELGGAYNQARWGNLNHVADDEEAAFAWVRDYLGYFPSTAYEKPPVVDGDFVPAITHRDRELDLAIPDHDNTSYDMRYIIERIVDDGEFLEISELYAPNIVTGYARINGRTVGVVANQPLVAAGVLDIDSAEKGTRFVRTCNAYNIPLLYLVDTPGFLPGVEQERSATIRRSAKFMYAYVEASVPKVTVVVRKAYGGAYAAMGSKQLGADINFAWPTAKFAVMGAATAAAVLTRKQTAGLDPAAAEKIRSDFVEFYSRMIGQPYLAAERGYVDAVIEPNQTRTLVASAFNQLADKTRYSVPRKHYLMPI